MFRDINLIVSLFHYRFQLQDDCRDRELTFEKVVSSETVSHITYDSLKILLGKILVRLSLFWQ